MSRLNLNVSFPAAFTMIPNTFLDQNMPRANGEFVKVYLYLLRAAESGDREITLSSIADRIFCTEKDVLRALRYWEKERLLLMEESDGTVSGITLLSGHEAEVPQAASAASLQQPAPQVSLRRQAQSSAAASSPRQNEESEEKDDRISLERALALREEEDIRELLFIAEQYLGKPLTQTEVQRLLFLYDDLHFTTDLIDYLIEYCVSKNHKSIYYIMKVAKNWHAEGITTVRAARASVNRYNRDYYEIMKALGITNRNPIDDEISYMKKWIEVYGFPMDIIQNACSRTVLNTEKPSFAYADSILKRWQKAGVTTAEDIAQLDALHEKRGRAPSERQTSPAAPRQTAVKKNAFNSFSSQHQYDFDELEKTLSKRVPG